MNPCFHSFELVMSGRFSKILINRQRKTLLLKFLSSKSFYIKNVLQITTMIQEQMKCYTLESYCSEAEELLTVF